ncbi:MAG: hypothetical protein LBU25_04410 [Treponema sp.]|jgi:hypothetical protein|nr:hypothetical protein [Treponema sp.]
MNEIINSTGLYKKYTGTSQDMSLCFNAHTYTPNMDGENDGLSYIFCAFRALKTAYRRKYENSLIIGSGSGADAMGAIKIFASNNITITDIMSGTLPVIKTNIEKYAQNCNFEIRGHLKTSVFRCFLPLWKKSPGNNLLYYNKLAIFSADKTRFAAASGNPTRVSRCGPI